MRTQVEWPRTDMGVRLLGNLWRIAALLALGAGLSACGSFNPFGTAPTRPQPAELTPVTSLLSTRLAWTARVGEVQFPMNPAVLADSVFVAGGAEGTVIALDAATGRERWRHSAGSRLTAGVGSDGRTAAVVTEGNDLVVSQDGRELWRQRMSAQVITTPLVAGGRVFVQVADRTVVALDGTTGRRLWSQQRPGDALILKQSGVLTAVGDTLVVGFGGRLVGLNPTNGQTRWDVPVVTSRGTNELERLVDLVGRPARFGDALCVRSYQMAIGCVRTERPGVAWTKTASGSHGVAVDERFVFATEGNGRVLAFRRDDGEQVWSTDRFAHRGLSAPLSLGRSVVFGDFQGFVHVLAREDGSVLSRLATDGSPVAAPPVLAGSTLVIVTRNGSVFGFQPD
jgi:outer membrane assembly lipoprotein YfgL